MTAVSLDDEDDDSSVTSSQYYDQGAYMLGEDGVPEKLRTYLDKKAREAMMFGAETAKVFRIQVEAFQTVLTDLPKALLPDHLPACTATSAATAALAGFGERRRNQRLRP